MANKDGIYKCELCGNIVSVLIAGAGDLVCCGQNMKQFELKSGPETGTEKHTPVLVIDGKNVTVKVGDVPHPMEEAHHIQFVQLVQDGRVIAEKRLFSGQEPKVMFCLDNTDNLTAREFCNLHGLWTTE